MSKTLKFSAAILVAILVLEGFASFGVVMLAAWTGRDYRAVAMDLHVTNLLMPLVIGRHDIEIQVPARFIGRYTGHVASELHVADGLLGWRPAKSISTYDSMKEDRFGISEFAPGETAIYPWRFTNGQGFFSSGELDFNYLIPKPIKTFRIIILGGSTVAGDWSESHKDTLPAKLLDHLKARASERGLDGFDNIELINAGVGGYDSSQQYLYLLADLWAYQADLIITYDGWNDFQGYNKNYRSPGFGQQPFRSDTHLNNDRRLRRSFTLIGSAEILAQELLVAVTDFARGFTIPYAIGKLVEHATYQDPAKDMSRTASDNLQEFMVERAGKYFENIRRTLLFAEENNSAYAAFLQPLFGVDNKAYVGWERRYVESNAERISLIKAFYDLSRDFYQRLAREQGQQGRFCISDISGTALRQVKQRAYSDHGHLLGVGNDAVARSIIDELDRCRLIPWGL